MCLSAPPTAGSRRATCPRGRIETRRSGSALSREVRDDRVPRLVRRDALALLRIEQRLARIAEEDLVHRRREIALRERVGAAAHGDERGLVAEVRQIGAAEARRGAREVRERHVRPERLVARVHAQDGEARVALRAGRRRPGDRSARAGASAGSSTSGRLVAAMTTVWSFGVKPSISERSWLSVCSRSSLPPPRPAPRERPTASISSMNTIAGAAAFASSKSSRTRAAPTPTKSWMNSEPFT